MFVLPSYPAVRLETGRDGACQQSTAQRMGREGDKVCGDGEMMCVVCISTCPQLAVLCGQPPDAPRAGGVLGYPSYAIFVQWASPTLASKWQEQECGVRCASCLLL
ncbi:hypothetical protein [Bacteroides sp. BFG-606]|uniref:hypothetical protein n=1 Tax=Bacteroides sp. BFG-606 TaxID=2972763 RepID=UPI0021663D5D|nr:hypothetical protein [Bacteroides sp. BFG-606]MCS2336020.1 hypothetical protein [Bacteroides sp. BFG-606]